MEASKKLRELNVKEANTDERNGIGQLPWINTEAQMKKELYNLSPFRVGASPYATIKSHKKDLDWM